jgi:hypothetical protein
MKKTFKIRCSAIGDIMTNSKKKGELSKTAKTYCQTWLKEQIYGKHPSINSKYIRKGVEVEEESIEFAAEQLGWGMVFKNEEYFENDFMQGTPDLILPDMIVDMKNSWDCFTFPLFDTIPDKGYWWQLQGYMILTGRKKAKLVYTLMDTPDDIIDDYITDEQTIHDFRFSDVPPQYRIKSFNIELDPNAEAQIIQRVKECRTYIKTLI